MKQSASGVQTVYGYEAASQYGALYRETRETRIAGQAVPGHSTRKVTYVSAQGNNTRVEKYALLTDGTWTLTDTADYEYDRENRWIKRTRGNGRVTEREMMCCGPLWEKDEDGIMTTYSYNTVRQLVEVSRSEVTDGETIVTPETIVSYTRDAFGRILQTRRDVGPMTTTESRAYDLLGQLVQETDVLGRSSTRAYSADGLTETVTTPTGATLVTIRHADRDRAGAERHRAEASPLPYGILRGRRGPFHAASPGGGRTGAGGTNRHGRQGQHGVRLPGERQRRPCS